MRLCSFRFNIAAADLCRVVHRNKALKNDDLVPDDAVDLGEQDAVADIEEESTLDLSYLWLVDARNLRPQSPASMNSTAGIPKESFSENVSAANGLGVATGAQVGEGEVRFFFSPKFERRPFLALLDAMKAPSWKMVSRRRWNCLGVYGNVFVQDPVFKRLRVESCRMFIERHRTPLCISI